MVCYYPLSQIALGLGIVSLPGLGLVALYQRERELPNHKTT